MLNLGHKNLTTWEKSLELVKEIYLLGYIKENDILGLNDLLNHNLNLISKLIRSIK